MPDSLPDTEHRRGGEKRVGRRAEQKRRWDRENRRRCVDCGGLTGGRTHARCRPCHDQLLAHQAALSIDAFRDLWNEGVLMRAIAERLGTTLNSVRWQSGELRRLGIIDYRYAGRRP